MAIDWWKRLAKKDENGSKQKDSTVATLNSLMYCSMLILFTSVMCAIYSYIIHAHKYHQHTHTSANAQLYTHLSYVILQAFRLRDMVNMKGIK